MWQPDHSGSCEGTGPSVFVLPGWRHVERWSRDLSLATESLRKTYSGSRGRGSSCLVLPFAGFYPKCLFWLAESELLLLNMLSFFYLHICNKKSKIIALRASAANSSCVFRPASGRGTFCWSHSRTDAPSIELSCVSCELAIGVETSVVEHNTEDQPSLLSPAQSDYLYIRMIPLVQGQLFRVYLKRTEVLKGKFEEKNTWSFFF